MADAIETRTTPEPEKAAGGLSDEEWDFLMSYEPPLCAGGIAGLGLGYFLWGSGWGSGWQGWWWLPLFGVWFVAAWLLSFPMNFVVYYGLKVQSYVSQRGVLLLRRARLRLASLRLANFALPRVTVPSFGDLGRGIRGGWRLAWGLIETVGGAACIFIGGEIILIERTPPTSTVGIFAILFAVGGVWIGWSGLKKLRAWWAQG